VGPLTILGQYDINAQKFRKILKIAKKSRKKNPINSNKIRKKCNKFQKNHIKSGKNQTCLKLQEVLAYLIFIPKHYLTCYWNITLITSSY